MIQKNDIATKADLRELATKKELHNLARMTAEGFADVTAKMATKQELIAVKQEMRAGFGLIMENLTPLRRDYEALKNDIAPEVINLGARLTKVERKVGL